MNKHSNKSIPMYNSKNQKIPPIGDGDYYVENGFYVFTEQYHKKRGYCCKNNCRHCPYGNTKKVEAKK